MSVVYFDPLCCIRLVAILGSQKIGRPGQWSELVGQVLSFSSRSGSEGNIAPGL